MFHEQANHRAAPVWRGWWRRASYLHFEAIDQLSQLVAFEPIAVGVAGVAKTVRKAAAIRPIFRAPPLVHGTDDIGLIHFDGVAGLVLCDQHLMQFFSGTNADGLHLAAGSDDLRQF